MDVEKSTETAINSFVQQLVNMNIIPNIGLESETRDIYISGEMKPHTEVFLRYTITFRRKIGDYNV